MWKHYCSVCRAEVGMMRRPAQVMINGCLRKIKGQSIVLAKYHFKPGTEETCPGSGTEMWKH